MSFRTMIAQALLPVVRFVARHDAGAVRDIADGKVAKPGNWPAPRESTIEGLMQREIGEYLRCNAFGREIVTDIMNEKRRSKAPRRRKPKPVESESGL